MDLILKKKFSADTNISDSTIDAKFSDCIRYVGRQTYIDRDKFEEVLPERSRQGRVTKRTIAKSTKLGLVEYHITRAKKQLKKLERAAQSAKKLFEAAEPANKERRLLVYLDAQKQIQVLEVKNQTWVERRNELIEKKKAELADFDTEGLLDSI